MQKQRVAAAKQKEAVKEENLLRDQLTQNNASVVSLGGPGPLGVPEDVERDVYQAGKQELSDMDWKKAEGLLRTVDSLRNRKGEQAKR